MTRLIPETSAGRQPWPVSATGMSTVDRERAPPEESGEKRCDGDRPLAPERPFLDIAFHAEKYDDALS